MMLLKQVTLLWLPKIPITGKIGITATLIENFHADPADRFIVATAQLHGLSLVTADRAVMHWSGQMNRHDARV